jgi:hypothetical protein
LNGYEETLAPRTATRNRGGRKIMTSYNIIAPLFALVIITLSISSNISTKLIYKNYGTSTPHTLCDDGNFKHHNNNYYQVQDIMVMLCSCTYGIILA